LHKLLAGTPPASKKALENAGMLEMLRWTREQEPSKPSTKLSTADGLPTLAANRGTEPTKLTKLVRGELDWIVMKALEKDRNRRYESANGFAMDVQRYLADEPVLACPPSVGYRCRKFVRRNKGPVVAACLVLAALVSGIIGTSWQALRAEQARHAEEERAEGETTAKREAEAARKCRAKRADAEATERKRAEAAELLAKQNEKKANDERNRAEVEKQIAQAVTDFLRNDLLRMANPWHRTSALRLAGGDWSAAENPTIKELLDRAAAQL